MISKVRKVAAASVLAAAGVLALGAFGSTAMAAESAPSVAPLAVTGAAQLDPRCDCLPGPAPRPEKPAPAPEQPAPEQPAPSEPSTPSVPSTPPAGEATCPAVVPSNPTGADYVNAWNESGMCLGAGAAGLVSSAWAGAIPSIVQGAAGAVAPAAKADEAGSLTAPVVVPSNPTGADYVNAWNQSGALAGAGAAGLVSSAWAGAIPSIVQGAAGSVSTPAKADQVRPAHKPAAAKSHKDSKPAKATKSTTDSKASTRQSEGLTAPVVVPSNPTGADYVNAWNQAGALAGAGAAGLVSSAWAGAIPSIVQGALG